MSNTTNWNAWGENWPDSWQDTGKRVELLLRGGARLEGVLEAEEYFTGTDEIPVFSLLTDDGRNISFVEHEKWRYIGEPN